MCMCGFIIIKANQCPVGLGSEIGIFLVATWNYIGIYYTHAMW